MGREWQSATLKAPNPNFPTYFTLFPFVKPKNEKNKIVLWSLEWWWCLTWTSEPRYLHLYSKMKKQSLLRRLPWNRFQSHFFTAKSRQGYMISLWMFNTILDKLTWWTKNQMHDAWWTSNREQGEIKWLRELWWCMNVFWII